jgi:hypothetical protein
VCCVSFPSTLTNLLLTRFADIQMWRNIVCEICGDTKFTAIARYFPLIHSTSPTTPIRDRWRVICSNCRALHNDATLTNHFNAITESIAEGKKKKRTFAVFQGRKDEIVSGGGLREERVSETTTSGPHIKPGASQSALDALTAYSKDKG